MAMVLSLLISTSIFNVLIIITNGIAFNNDNKEVSDMPVMIITAKFCKIIGEFIAIMILIYMFWGYALAVRQASTTEASEKSKRTATVAE